MDGSCCLERNDELMDGISLMNEKLRSILASNSSVCTPDKMRIKFESFTCVHYNQEFNSNLSYILIASISAVCGVGGWMMAVRYLNLAAAG